MEGFHRCKGKYLGIANWCSECENAESRMRTSEGKNIQKNRRSYQNNKSKNAERIKRYYQSHKEAISNNSKRWYQENKEKWLAKKIVYIAIKTGRIKKRNICEICYNSPTIMHHYDYMKPVDIIELCQACHSRLHSFINKHHGKLGQFGN